MIYIVSTYSRVIREQIFAAFGFHKLKQKFNIREGVAFSNDKNTELLFITLNKSEKDFSSSTLYEDFAISDKLFDGYSQSIKTDKIVSQNAHGDGGFAFCLRLVFFHQPFNNIDFSFILLFAVTPFSNCFIIQLPYLLESVYSRRQN